MQVQLFFTKMLEKLIRLQLVAKHFCKHFLEGRGVVKSCGFANF